MSNSVFTLYDSSKQTSADLLNAMIGNVSGINIISDSINYLGADMAASTFTEFDFGGLVKMGSSGILLTSGNGAPALENLDSSHSKSNNTEGDLEFDTLAKDAFNYAGTTYDASILEFSFTVDNPEIKSVSFDVIFGSEEFPNYIDSSYVDIAAVLVNGVNYGLFDGDPEKPLSIIGNSVGSGSFYDNGTGNSSNSSYSIEYNGISPLMTVKIPLDGSDIYSVRLGVADTGDRILDSGLFISNFSSNTSAAGGLLVNVAASPEGGVLNPAGEDTATFFIGGEGDDTMNGSTASDVYDLLAGGSNTVQGTLEQLNNDVILGFNNEDTLSFLDTFFNFEDITVTMGSAIIEVDANGDGKSDSKVTLEGNYEKAEFFVDQTSNGSEITVKSVEASIEKPMSKNQFFVNDFMKNLAGSEANLNVSLQNVFAKILANQIRIEKDEVTFDASFEVLSKVFTFIATHKNFRPDSFSKYDKLQMIAAKKAAAFEHKLTVGIDFKTSVDNSIIQESNINKDDIVKSIVSSGIAYNSTTNTSDVDNFVDYALDELVLVGSELLTIDYLI